MLRAYYALFCRHKKGVVGSYKEYGYGTSTDSYLMIKANKYWMICTCAYCGKPLDSRKIKLWENPF